MKIRSDFVTNSSSSSFIVCFKNNEDFSNAMNTVAQNYSPEVFTTLYKDLCESSNRKTRAEALKILKEAYQEEIEFKLIYGYNLGMGGFYSRTNKYGSTYAEIYKNPEFKKDVKEYVNKQLEKAMQALPKRGIIAEVEYADEDGSFFSDMEHEIMPYMPFVFKTISHH